MIYIYVCIFMFNIGCLAVGWLLNWPTNLVILFGVSAICLYIRFNEELKK